ncbi:hypothetical protein ACLKA7_016475 [Drosophila subpalustris]
MDAMSFDDDEDSNFGAVGKAVAKELTDNCSNVGNTPLPLAIHLLPTDVDVDDGEPLTMTMTLTLILILSDQCGHGASTKLMCEINVFKWPTEELRATLPQQTEQTVQTKPAKHFGNIHTY